MMAGVTMRGVLQPLTSGATYRRGVFLILGGVLALPYVLIVIAFWQMWTTADVDRVVTLVLAAVTAVIALTPAFLPATRIVEIAVVRNLLTVDFPQPPPGRLDRETRLRSALWFGLHLVIGGLVGLAVVIALPMALVMLVQQLGVGTGLLGQLAFGPLDESSTAAWTILGFAALVAMVYAFGGLGALAAQVAPTLLGPSPAERIANLEAEASDLAERNRLARELHDSVGHALTVTTLQAAAARRLLDTDPDFVRRALTAVEETGRVAMEDLDHVLGLLRNREDTVPLPQRTLANLDRLLADAASAGLQVRRDVTGDVGALPAAVSRECYRIVQECLTNIAKHVGPTTADLQVAVHPEEVRIVATNPMNAASSTGNTGGRGLVGMRERVEFLGGTVESGRDGEDWRVVVNLPITTKGPIE